LDLPEHSTHNQTHKKYKNLDKKGQIHNLPGLRLEGVTIEGKHNS
jgi:hypothetical protein